jgi:hypothetical protein
MSKKINFYYLYVINFLFIVIFGGMKKNQELFRPKKKDLILLLPIRGNIF